MSEPGASTSQSEASSDIDVEAATLLSQGRRNLLVGDPPSAVQSLQEACELLGGKYGELANECGESYYYYGWALLELARMETGVLGNALQGVPEEEDTEGETEADKIEGEEREKIFHEVQEALEDTKDEVKGQESETDKENASEKEDAKMESEVENTKTESEKGEPKAASEGEKTGDKPNANDTEKPEEEIKEQGKGKKEENAEGKAMEVDDTVKTDSKKDGDKVAKEGKDGGAEPAENAEGAEGEAAVEEGAEEDEDEEEDGAKAAEDETKDDDVSNFQLSWEMLELARVIFSRQEGEEFKLKVSQVCLKLGELGLETGNYAQSVEDFTLCLNRQKELLKDDSRLLAETYYNLALAYSFDQKFDKAIENFSQSTVVIENRIATLSKKTETDPATLEEDQKEIKELQALIPEIKAKIDDAKAEKTTAENAIGQAMRSAAAEFGLGTSSSSGFPSCSSAGPAQTIAVRKPSQAPSGDAKPDDISHLVHRKRKPEEDAEPETAKKSRQEEGGGDAATANNVNGTNRVEQTAMNGDAKQSPEKPEIKVKQVEQKTNGSADTAAMET